MRKSLIVFLTFILALILISAAQIFHKNSGQSTSVGDFNAFAEHILELEANAHKNGLKIKKVIFKISLKDDLFTSEYGKKLKATNIYFAQRLTPMLNKLHDDHYHVDFEPI